MSTVIDKRILWRDSDCKFNKKFTEILTCLIHECEGSEKSDSWVFSQFITFPDLMRQRLGSFCTTNPLNPIIQEGMQLSRDIPCFWLVPSSSEAFCLHVLSLFFIGIQWYVYIHMYENNSEDQKGFRTIMRQSRKLHIVELLLLSPFVFFFFFFHGVAFYEYARTPIILRTKGWSAWSNVISSRGGMIRGRKRCTRWCFVPTVRAIQLHHHAGTEVHSLIRSAQACALVGFY